jgi:uncharacterized membrane protein (DUF2068 family)
LVLLAVAAAIDGTVTLTEAWLLHLRKPWALWLVVVASSAPIPWEVYELSVRFRPVRLLVLLLNIGIAIFLSVHARKHAASYSSRSLTSQRS